MLWTANKNKTKNDYQWLENNPPILTYDESHFFICKEPVNFFDSKGIYSHLKLSVMYQDIFFYHWISMGTQILSLNFLGQDF